MTCWAIIPLKASAEAKSRLAGALDDAAREALVRAMAAHVAAAARGAVNIDRLCMVAPGVPDFGPDFLGDALLVADPGQGLNPALAAALAEVGAQGASRAVIVAADLPTLAPRDLELLAAAPAGEIAIAPDRHGTGTNALSLPLPQAAGFAFAFGPDSFALHHAEAERLGLAIEVIHSHGLARDIDEPPDLADAAALLDRQA